MFVSMQQLLQQPAHQSLVDSAEKLVQLMLEHIGECNATSTEAKQAFCVCAAVLEPQSKAPCPVHQVLEDVLARCHAC